MKITVSAMYLLRNLKSLSSVVNTSNTMPILDNFLFEVSGNKLKVTATDLETTMSVTMDVESDENKSFAVPARLLVDILGTLPEQPLVFDVAETIITIISLSGEYSLACHNADEYPKSVEIQSPSTTSIPAKVLSTAIIKTIFATSTYDLRPVMCGVLFQLTTEGIIFVATDAHKLVKYSRKDIFSSENVNFIMPKKPLNVLKSILGTAAEEDNVTIEYNEANAKFIFEEFTLICRLIDGKFPKFEAVIPSDNNNDVVIDRSSLLSSVRRVSILSNKSTHEIAFEIKGNDMKISTFDVDYSTKADETLVCNHEGDDIRIGFNAKYLKEMLGELNCDEVKLSMSLPNRAGILTPLDGLDDGEELLMLVMPVMLKS